jgi:hypothetical protein
MAQKTQLPMGGGQSLEAVLHFTGEDPQFNISASSPSEISKSPEETAKLQEQLGQMAHLLSQRDAEIEELQIRLAYLEANQISGANKAEQVGYLAVSSEMIAASSQNGSPLTVERESPDAVVKIETGGGNLTESTKSEIDLTPDPNLVRTQQVAEQIVLYLLSKPGFTMQHPNVGGFIRKELGIDKISDWGNARAILKEFGVVSSQKLTPQSRKSKGISLNVEELTALRDKPFVTPRVMSTIKRFSENGDADLVKHMVAEEAQPASSGNGGGSKYAISSRVRKLAAAEPTSSSPNSTYRARGKNAQKTREVPKPFLGHRRETRGVKRAH